MSAMAPVSIFWRVLPRRCIRDEGGVSAVEFALILPFMLIIYLGAFQLTQALSAYRKMTITTRAVVDLATQYPQMSANDVSTVLSAASQVMTPYPTTNMSIVLSEFTTCPLTTSSTPACSSNMCTIPSTLLAPVTYVQWSQSSPTGSARTSCTKFTLPTGMAQAGASVMLSEVTYKYAPPVLYKMTGTFSMSDKLYMSPRQVQAITYTN